MSITRQLYGQGVVEIKKVVTEESLAVLGFEFVQDELRHQPDLLRDVPGGHQPDLPRDAPEGGFYFEPPGLEEEMDSDFLLGHFVAGRKRKRDATKQSRSRRSSSRGEDSPPHEQVVIQDRACISAGSKDDLNNMVLLKLSQATLGMIELIGRRQDCQAAMDEARKAAEDKQRELQEEVARLARELEEEKGRSTTLETENTSLSSERGDADWGSQKSESPPHLPSQEKDKGFYCSLGVTISVPCWRRKVVARKKYPYKVIFLDIVKAPWCSEHIPSWISSINFCASSLLKHLNSVPLYDRLYSLPHSSVLLGARRLTTLAVIRSVGSDPSRMYIVNSSIQSGSLSVTTKTCPGLMLGSSNSSSWVIALIWSRESEPSFDRMSTLAFSSRGTYSIRYAPNALSNSNTVSLYFFILSSLASNSPVTWPTINLESHLTRIRSAFNDAASLKP
ncbi:unnamed protein product [Cuscuta campestris]|uniref:Uncharacterized protein n=1 Tax=Cuscuta campestris TaxID=132261 RepID=A0A484N1B6_9ASTE|nr:unnamed protein product [Cuscuta campestris]